MNEPRYLLKIMEILSIVSSVEVKVSKIEKQISDFNTRFSELESSIKGSISSSNSKKSESLSDKKWLTKREACQATGLSLRALNYKLSARQFTHRKAGGRVYLHAGELADFVKHTIVKRKK